MLRTTQALMQGARDLATSLRECQKGVAAVEWAAIASFLIFMTIGALDFAVVAHHKMQVTNAVRAGIQYATVRKPVQQDTSGIVAAIDIAAPADETDSRVIEVTFYCECSDGTAVDCSDPCATGDRQSYVSIRVEEQHELMFPLPFVANSRTLRSHGTVRLN